MRRLLATALIGSLALVGPNPASALIFVTPGNVGSLADDNLISSSTCASHVDGPGQTIQGCLNGNHNHLVTVTTDPSHTIFYDSNGQAEIMGGIDQNNQVHYSNLTFQVLGHTFGSIIMDIVASADGQVRFSDNLADVSGFFTLSAGGNNFFTITDTDISGSGVPQGLFTTVSFTTFVGGLEADIVDHTKQVRIGYVDGVPAPEPASLALLGTALFGLGAIRRRHGPKSS